MARVRTWVGLDVHAAKVVAAIADSESGELAVRRTGGATEQVAEFCAALPAPVRVAYEGGPTGFGLARALAAKGIECTVAASPWEQSVARLRCLRGIDILLALGLYAEVGDFDRFARPAR